MAARQVCRILVALDIERFGRPDRDDQDRVQLRRDLHALLTRALTDVGINAGCWSATSTGDGLLVVVDPAAETARVLRAMLDQLPVGLAEHNDASSEPARLRVRVVVHAAHAMLDDQGVTGEQVNLAFRLLDAEPLRARLRAVQGPLVVGVSAEVYEQVVRHRPLAWTRRRSARSRWR